MTDFENAITNCARKMSGFHQNSVSIGYEAALKRVARWIENFDGLGVNPSILKTVLEKIEFISDESIRSVILEFVKKQYGEHSVYYTSLGEENESSSRIVASLNNNPNYSRDIFSLLEKLRSEKVSGVTIVFMDDFLNTGGQFSHIINDWFSARPKRRAITRDLLDILHSSHLCFMFYHGMETGRIRAEEAIRNHNLNGKIHIINQYADTHGIFGNSHNLSLIKECSENYSEHGSIFTDLKCRDIQQFLSVCAQAGEQLYRQYKPHNSEKAAQRALGYGNSAKLFIGQNNIPTCTLTCLWLGGSVNIGGKDIRWEPLLSRSEKTSAGSESAPVISTVGDKYSRAFLDKKYEEPPLQIAIAEKLPEVILDPATGAWTDVTEKTLRQINPSGSISIESFQTTISKLSPSSYQSLNNHLKFHLRNTEKPLGVKISDIVLITFGGLASFLQIHFSFRGSTDLLTALKVNNVIGLKQQRGNLSGYFTLSGKKETKDGFTIYQLFEFIAGSLGNRTDLNSIEAIHETGKCTKAHHYLRFSYIRENGVLFRTPARQPTDLIKFACDYAVPSEDNLRRADTFESIDLSVDATVGWSRKGVVFVCGNNTKNLSIQNLFFNRYAVCYLLVTYLETICNEYRSGSTDENRKTEIRKSLEKFALFPFESMSDTVYFSQFSKRVCDYFNIRESIGIIQNHKELQANEQ